MKINHLYKFILYISSNLKNIKNYYLRIKQRHVKNMYIQSNFLTVKKKKYWKYKWTSEHCDNISEKKSYLITVLTAIVILYRSIFKSATCIIQLKMSSAARNFRNIFEQAINEEISNGPTQRLENSNWCHGKKKNKNHNQ